MKYIAMFLATFAGFMLIIAAAFSDWTSAIALLILTIVFTIGAHILGTTGL